MAQILLTPRNGSVLVGTTASPSTECGLQIISVAFPTNPQMTTVPATYGQDGRQLYTSKSRTMVVRWLQDWTETNGFSRFLATNDGSEVYMKVIPTSSVSTGVPSWLVKFQAITPNVLGDAGSHLEDTMTFPVVTLTPTYV